MKKKKIKRIPGSNKSEKPKKEGSILTAFGRYIDSILKHDIQKPQTFHPQEFKDKEHAKKMWMEIPLRTRQKIMKHNRKESILGYSAIFWVAVIIIAGLYITPPTINFLKSSFPPQEKVCVAWEYQYTFDSFLDSNVDLPDDCIYDEEHIDKKNSLLTVNGSCMGLDFIVLKKQKCTLELPKDQAELLNGR